MASLFTSLKQVLILSLFAPLLLGLFTVWILCTSFQQFLFRSEALDSDLLNTMHEYRASLERTFSGVSLAFAAFDSVLAGGAPTMPGDSVLSCGCGMTSSSQCGGNGVLAYYFSTLCENNNTETAGGVLARMVAEVALNHSAEIEEMWAFYDRSPGVLIHYPCSQSEVALYCTAGSSTIIPSLVTEIRRSLHTSSYSVKDQRIWKVLKNDAATTLIIRPKLPQATGLGFAVVNSTSPWIEKLWKRDNGNDAEFVSWWGNSGTETERKYFDCVDRNETCGFPFSARGMGLVFPFGGIVGVGEHAGVILAKGDNNTGIKLLFGTIVVLLVLSLFLGAWVHVAADGVVNPFCELVKKLRSLRNDEGKLKNNVLGELRLDTAAVNFTPETAALYVSVEKMALLLRENVPDAPRQILTFAELYEQYKDTNHKAAATCLNNIGNSHFAAGRYEEAKLSFEKAIEFGGEGFETETDPGQRNIYKRLCAFRTFQFGRTLYYQSLGTSTVRERAMKCLKSAKELLILLGNHVDLIIQTLIFLSHCELESGMTQTASRTLQEAADLLADWGKGIIQINEKTRDFAALEPEILRQRIALLLGKALERCGRNKEAFGIYSKCITMGRRFDPDVRLEALQKIQSLLQRSGAARTKSVRNVERLIGELDLARSFVVLFDGSVFANEKKHLSCECLRTLFETAVDSKDYVSLTVFHKNPHVLFPLTEKWKNTENLRGQIRSLETFEYKSRSRSVTKSLLAGLNSVIKLTTRIGGKIWVVLFTSGFDLNSSRDKLKEVKEKLQGNTEIGLIVFVPRGISKEEKEKMGGICGCVRESFYVELENEVGVKLAMAAMRKVTLGEQPVIVEQFT